MITDRPGLIIGTFKQNHDGTFELIEKTDTVPVDLTERDPVTISEMATWLSNLEHTTRINWHNLSLKKYAENDLHHIFALRELISKLQSGDHEIYGGLSGI